MNRDLEHLKLLAIFHFILSGITGLGALLPVIHLLIGLALISGKFDQTGGPPPPKEVGYFFVVFAAALILFGLTLAGFLAFAGRCLLLHRHYVLCFAVAVISCLFMPFGTVLGVFTIVVLTRDSVRDRFAGVVSDERWPSEGDRR